MATRPKYWIQRDFEVWEGVCTACGWRTPHCNSRDDAEELIIEHTYECAE